MEELITTNSTLAILGFVGVIALLFLLITAFKWHVFFALLVPILLFGMLPTIDRQLFIDAFSSGFGGTVEDIAVVIVLGSILGEALKETGGVERITLSMIGLVGRARMPLALTLSGFIVGIAIFSDVGYVILNPLVHSAAISSGVNMAVMATGLVTSMQLTHAMVPPTPGPLAAVALVEADVGLVILWGSAATFVASLAAYLYARVLGPRIESEPDREFLGQSFVEQGREHELPSTLMAYLPIIVPLILIAGQSVISFLVDEGTISGDNILVDVAIFIGWPVVALSIGLVIAYMNAKGEQKEKRRSIWAEEGLRTSAMIIIVTGLGGSLSRILRTTPAVDEIAQFIADAGVPNIFLPFVLGVIGNMITGSTTVGVITAASIAAPMMDTLGLSPEATMLAGASGSVIIKYVNSSYFWVTTTLSRMPLRSALVMYGGGTLIGGVVSMAMIYLFWAVGFI